MKVRMGFICKECGYTYYEYINEESGSVAGVKVCPRCHEHTPFKESKIKVDFPAK